jgi:hypothetical protein
MIYTKINKRLYNEDNIKDIAPYSNDYYFRIKAIHRIIKNTIKKDLKDYPDIDIYVSFKFNKNLLGQFKRRPSKEYKKYNYEPCIILFFSAINNYYLKHSVKGIKQVIFHEYCHFKDYLLNNKLKHGNGLEAIADNRNVDNQIKQCKQYIKV